MQNDKRFKHAGCPNVSQTAGGNQTDRQRCGKICSYMRNPMRQSDIPPKIDPRDMRCIQLASSSISATSWNCGQTKSGTTTRLQCIASLATNVVTTNRSVKCMPLSLATL